MRLDEKKLITKTSTVTSSITLDRQTNTHIQLGAVVTLTIDSALTLPVLSRKFTVSGSLKDSKTAEVKHDNGTTVESIGFIGESGVIVIDSAGIPTVHSDREILNELITHRATSMMNGGGIVEMYYDYTTSEYKLAWSHRIISIPGASHLGTARTTATGYFSISPFAAGISLGSSRDWKIVYGRLTDAQLRTSTGSINIANANVFVDYYTTYKHSPNNIVIALVSGDNNSSTIMGNGVGLEQFGKNATATAMARILRESYSGCELLNYDRQTKRLIIDRAMWINNCVPGVKSGYYLDLFVDKVLNAGVDGWLVVFATLTDNAFMNRATQRITSADVKVVKYNVYHHRIRDWIIGYVNGDTDEFVMIGEGTSHAHTNNADLHLSPADRVKLSSIITPNNIVPRPSLVDPTAWVVTPFGTTPGSWPEGWQGLNGSPSENAIISETDPVKLLNPDANNEELHWVCKAEAAGGPAGGFRSATTPVDNTKKYRVVIYVRNDGLNASAARIYSGLYGMLGTVNKGVEYLHTGASTTNAYFWSGDFSLMDEWYAIVGYIHPAGTPTSPIVNNESGIYLVRDGTMTKQSFGNVYDFRFSEAFDVDGLVTRVYQYYPNSPLDQKTIMCPTLELVDGTEGSLNDILLLPKAHISGGTAGDKEGGFRYNPITQKHEGFNGTAWTPFN